MRSLRSLSARYDLVIINNTQKIVFQDQYRTKENMVELYLVDLAQLCYENVVILTYLSELMYSLRKLDYIKEGLRPNIMRK